MKLHRNPSKIVLVVLLAFSPTLFALSGCGSNNDKSQNGDVGPGEYAKLPRSLATQNDSLRAQLTALRESEQFPRALTSHGRTVAGKQGRKRPSQSWLADEQNFAIDLAKMGPESKSSFQRESKKLDGMLSPAALPWSREAMERVELFLDSRKADVQVIQAALDLPQSDFGIRIDKGLLADVDGVQRALFAGRLMAVSTILDIRQDNLKRAEADVSRLFHLAQGLSQESHLVPRVAGARVREDAFLALRSLCQAPALEAEQLDRLTRDVAVMVAQWPEDALVWGGERAQGMHAYEMVRAGEVLSLLKDDELAAVRSRGLNDFTESVMEQVDEDEQFYIKTMKRIIDSCSEPYYIRVETIEKILLDVQEVDEDTRSAWLATNILLAHVSDGLYWQAHDRALAEAWLIALNTATTGEAPPPRNNPLTGRPFHVVVGELNVSVSGISDETLAGWQTPEPIVVPRLAQVANRGRHLR